MRSLIPADTLKDFGQEQKETNCDFTREITSI